MPLETDVVIIGGGPAGLTAGLYSARAQLNTIILEPGQPGGQIAQTDMVENYPGFPSGISGTELAMRMLEQAERFGAQLKVDAALEVKKTDRGFLIRGQEDAYLAKTVILATGANPRKLGVPGEDQYYGRGVSTCATCDGFFYKDQDVAVVGGGNTAVEEALYLSNIARKVYLVHRRDTLRAEKIMQDKLFAKVEAGKIEPVWHHVVDEVLGNDAGVTGMRLKSVLDGSTREIDVQGFFVAIGHTPNTGLFEGQLAMDNGYIEIRSGLGGNATATSVPGVFAAGDVTDQHYRQAITSAGFGCMAALDAERFLDKEA